MTTKILMSMAGDWDLSTQYSGPEKPFADFEIPAAVQSFVQDLVRFNKDRADRYPALPPRTVDQVLLFGGSVLDQKLGTFTKDYDIYICAPQLVSEVEKCKRDSDVEETVGYQFPAIVNPEGVTFIKQNNLSGRSFGLNCLYTPVIDGQLAHDEACILDLFIGENKLDPKAYSAFLSQAAPVLSAVASIFPESGMYAYHQAFNRHAEQRILCTEHVHDPKFLDKARRKKLEIVSPEQLAAREALTLNV